jgi:hypothetical protein
VSSAGMAILLSALYALTAWALWTARRFGRPLGLLCCALSVCACPTGPILTLWGLWVLTRPEVVALLKGETGDAGPPAAPP